jgi:hypothetical protein
VPNTEAFNRKYVWTGAFGIASQPFLHQFRQIDYEDKSDERNLCRAVTRESAIATQAAGNYTVESGLCAWHTNTGEHETDESITQGTRKKLRKHDTGNPYRSENNRNGDSNHEESVDSSVKDQIGLCEIEIQKIRTSESELSALPFSTFQG